MGYGFNSTIKRKLKPCKRCGQPSYIFSRGRCANCAKIEDHQPIPEHSDNDLDILIHDLDILFSQYIRLKYSDKDGNGKCFTCDSEAFWQKLQNGHFIPRANMFLRFDERNCRPQCELCNCHKHGNISQFTKRLNEEKIGITEILYEEATTVYKYTRTELKELISEYSKKVGFLKEDLIQPER